MKNIILIGFDNSYKEEVADLLAKEMNYEAFHFNRLIVSISGRTSIKDIIQKDGELTRSRLETQILGEIDLNEDFIIATNENIIFNQINILTLKSNAHTIYLKDFRFDKDPLLENQKIRSLKDQLFKFYSDAFIEAENDTPEQIVYNIIDFLNTKHINKF